MEKIASNAGMWKLDIQKKTRLHMVLLNNLQQKDRGDPTPTIGTSAASVKAGIRLMSPLMAECLATRPLDFRQLRPSRPVYSTSERF